MRLNASVGALSLLFSKISASLSGQFTGFWEVWTVRPPLG